MQDFLPLILTSTITEGIFVSRNNGKWCWYTLISSLFREEILERPWLSSRVTFQLYRLTIYSSGMHSNKFHSPNQWSLNNVLLITFSLFTRIMFCGALSLFSVMLSNLCATFNAWLVTATPLRQGCLLHMRRVGLMLYTSLYQVKGHGDCIMLEWVCQQVMLKHLDYGTKREFTWFWYQWNLCLSLKKKKCKEKRHKEAINVSLLFCSCCFGGIINFKQNLFMSLILK